jgi:hypothetical protein
VFTKKTLLTVFFSICLHLAYSQGNKKFEFAGTLQLSTREIITFKLQYQVLQNNQIEGTSLTDIFGKDRTLCKIKGNINSEGNKISFTETGNVSTKSDADINTFCFLNVKNASIKTIKGKAILQGNFTGTYEDGKKCASGQIYLISSDYIEQLANKYLNKEHIKNADTLQKLQDLNADLQEKTNKTYLHSNDVLRLNWTSSEIILELSDSRKADGDELAIYINNKKVLDRFVISNEKKTIVVPFTETKGNIRIEALNEGTLKSCTASITLRDNENNTHIVTIMNKGSNVVILLNKKKVAHETSTEPK